MAKTRQKQLSGKDYTRKRIIGTEQEYGIWSRGNIDFDLNNSGFISNGGKVYRDCGHPEYASPEASNPLDAVKYSKAGEILVKRFVENGGWYHFFKHVSDGAGASFGAHESYSTDPFIWNFFIYRALPFFTTRMIYAGAGRIDSYGNYEISQKAQKINCLTGGDTRAERPIINLKEEPLSDRHMRLHMTSGDANMSEVAEYLKLGTTALVLDLFEDEKLNPPKVIESLESFHKISKDLTLKKRFKTDKGEMTAIEIQRYYQELAQTNYNGRDKMTDDILNRWKFVLDTLETDPMKLDRQIDWVIKKKLIDSYISKTGRVSYDPAVKNIDLMYHNIDKDKGLFYLLQNKGLVDRLLTDKQIEQAVDNPPEDTRAWIRGKLTNKNFITNMYWAVVYIKGENEDDYEKMCIENPFDNYKKLLKTLERDYKIN